MVLIRVSNESSCVTKRAADADTRVKSIAAAAAKSGSSSITLYYSGYELRGGCSRPQANRLYRSTFLVSPVFNGTPGVNRLGGRMVQRPFPGQTSHAAGRLSFPSKPRIRSTIPQTRPPPHTPTFTVYDIQYTVLYRMILLSNNTYYYFKKY